MIGLPEVRVGILPGAGGTQRMTRLLGTAKAMELMLLGNAVDADTAERLGLVHRAVDAGSPDGRRRWRWRDELASRPPLSVALIKQCVLQGIEMPLEEALHFEQEAFCQTMRVGGREPADAGVPRERPRRSTSSRPPSRLLEVRA